jgi:hypothetical protein
VEGMIYGEVSEKEEGEAHSEGQKKVLFYERHT